MKKILATILLCLIILTSIFINKKNTSHYYQSQQYLNTVIVLQVPASISKSEGEDLWQQCLEIVKEIDNNYSLTKDSYLKKFNELHFNEKLEVSESFIELWELAQKYYEETNHYFNPSVYPISEAWGFSATNKTDEKPDEETLKQLLDLCDFNKLTLEKENDKYYLIKGIEDVIINGETYVAKVDMGAIIKGYVAQKLYDFLISEGVEAGRIIVGTSSGYVWGEKAQLDLKYENETILTTSINNSAYGISGLDQRNVTYDITYSHIINPFSGTALTKENKYLASLIISDNAIEADVYSSVALINTQQSLSEYLLLTKEKTIIGDLKYEK